jgi:hypothetical protein
VNCFHLTLSCASIIADLWNTGRLEYHILSLLRRKHHHSASSTVTDPPVDYKGILKMEGALARLSNANLSPPTTSPSTSSSAATALAVVAAATPSPARQRPCRRRPRRRRRPSRRQRRAGARKMPEEINKMVSVYTSVSFGRCDFAAFTRASRVLQQLGTKQVNRGCTFMYQYVQVCTCMERISYWHIPLCTAMYLHKP